MPKPDCKQLLSKTAEDISDILRNNMQEMADGILACMYHCFRQVFIKWAFVFYHQYPKELLTDISNNAFTDGLLKFKETATDKGFYNSSATLKTIIFSFCKNTLRENLQKEKRFLEKKKQLATVYQNETIFSNDEEITTPDEDYYLLIEQALLKMEEADRQIIIWRHLYQKTNIEIAEILGIAVPSATNRIYRCMQRLKQLTENNSNN